MNEASIQLLFNGAQVQNPLPIYTALLIGAMEQGDYVHAVKFFNEARVLLPASVDQFHPSCLQPLLALGTFLSPSNSS